MTRLEFEQVLEVFKIDSTIVDGCKEYTYHNHEIMYDDGYIFISNFPDEIKCNLCNNYSNEFDKVVDFANNGFILSKEVLAIILFEIKKNYSDEHINEPFELLDYIISIDEGMIEKINPYMTKYQWMESENNKEFYNLFLKDVNNSYKNLFSRILRNILDDFDNAVNPYLNKNIKFNNPMDYVTKVCFNGDLWDAERSCFDDKRENCSKLIITDVKTNNSVCHVRGKAGYYFGVRYKNDGDKEIIVDHEHNVFGATTEHRGEIVSVTFLDDDPDKVYSLYYNVTKDFVIESSDGPFWEFYSRNITLGERFKIVSELLKAKEYAKSITIDNIAEKGYVKQLRKRY